VTSTTVTGHFFGGPDDGATKVLDAEDLARGWVDTTDSLGSTCRYTIVKLDAPKQVEDVTVTHELRPSEGAW